MPTTPTLGFLDGHTLLQGWINRAQLSQRDAAEFLRMTPSYLSGILNRTRRPGLDNAVWIERMTGVVVEAWVTTADGGMAQPDYLNGKKRNVDKQLTRPA